MVPSVSQNTRDIIFIAEQEVRALSGGEDPFFATPCYLVSMMLMVVEPLLVPRHESGEKLAASSLALVKQLLTDDDSIALHVGCQAFRHPSASELA